MDFNKLNKQSLLAIQLLHESFLMALHSVVANKLRTILTLLGLTIGIFTIISVFTVVDSLESNIRENIASLGDNVVYVQKWPWSFEEDYKWWEYMKRPVPKIAEYEEIERKSQLAECCAFSVSTERAIKYKSNTANRAIIWANTHRFNEIRSFEIAEGRYFSLNESTIGRNVCVLGSRLKNDLFGNEEALGKFVKIDGKKIMVIGVMKKEGSGIFGGSMDDVVILPMNYARNIFDVRSEYLDPFIMVKSKANVPIEQLKDELRNILRNKRAIQPSKTDNFALNQASLISKGIDSIFIVLNIVGWIIGGFSILVGGFGIANIMFVSVRERTNQIGIQKALGAKKVFILFEFLSESVILALAGGIIGLIIVFGGTYIFNSIFDFKISLTVGNIINGLFISVAIGIVSGIMPSWKAAQMNPVEAINTTF